MNRYNKLPFHELESLLAARIRANEANSADTQLLKRAIRRKIIKGTQSLSVAEFVSHVAYNKSQRDAK